VSRAIPHYISVQDAAWQPARYVPCDSKAEALRVGAAIAREGFESGIVKVYKGIPHDGGSRGPSEVWHGPVKVWS